MSSGQKTNRKLRISPEDIKEAIDEKHSTAIELAQKFGVCKKTIRKKIKILRMDDEPVIHTPNGYISINRKWLEVPDNASEFEVYVRWIIAGLKALRPLANPVRPLLPQMRRTLALDSMSKEERRDLMKASARVTAFLAFSEVEDE
jgi:hypothetical protein